MADVEKILVVDDEIPVCKSISNALEDKGYIIDMVLSGEEALKKDEKNKYDIIITDLMMPGISGMELLKTVKQRRPEVKVIMVTGYPSIKSAVQSTKLGAFDYIPKPFTPNELRSLVSRALESKYHREKEKISVPRGLYGIPENSWVMMGDNKYVRIGIHHIFLKTIKDITSIEFPQKHEMRYQGEACLRITDSEKHLHKLWAPVSGTIVEINEDVKKDYSKLMNDPYNDGWILLISPIHLKDDLKNLTMVGSI